MPQNQKLPEVLQNIYGYTVFVRQVNIVFPCFISTVVLMSKENHQDDMSHDKTNKMSVCPAKTQISLGIRPV